MRLINADKLKEDKTMCRKIMIAMTCVIAMAGFNAVPVSACTPPLNPPSIEIPDINFQPDGALKDAIDNAVKNWLEKCILGTPTVKYASYCKSASRYFNYSHVAVKWSKLMAITIHSGIGQMILILRDLDIRRVVCRRQLIL